MGRHSTNQQNSTTSSKTSPSPAAAIEKAEGPGLDRTSLFAKAAERSESQRFLSREGVSAAEVKRHGHVPDTAGLTKDGKHGGTATFGNDSAVIRAQTDQMLKKLLPELQAAAREGHKIALDGHTSTVGSDAHNQRLSQRRVEAIRDYLVKAGIPKEQIEIKAHGESRPAVKETTVRGQALNRRVEISVERKAAPQPEPTAAAKPQASSVEIPAPAPTVTPVAPVVPQAPAVKQDVKPQEPQPLMRQEESRWPLFDQPRLGGVLLQPQPDGSGLKVNSVAGSDFQDFLGVRGVKPGPYVDFSHGVHIGELPSMTGSLGVSPNTRSQSGYMGQNGATVPNERSQDISDGANYYMGYFGQSVPMMTTPDSPRNSLAPSASLEATGAAAPGMGNAGFWRDTSKPATPVDVPRLRFVK